MLTAALLVLGLTANAADIGNEERVGVGIRAGASVQTLVGGGLTAKFWTVPGAGFVVHAGSRGGLNGRIPAYFGRIQFERDGMVFADGEKLQGAFYTASGLGWTGFELDDPTFATHFIGFSQGVGLDFRLRSIPLSIFAEAEFQYFLVSISQGQVGLGGFYDIGVGAGARYYF